MRGNDRDEQGPRVAILVGRQWMTLIAKTCGVRRWTRARKRGGEATGDGRSDDDDDDEQNSATTTARQDGIMNGKSSQIGQHRTPPLRAQTASPYSDAGGRSLKHIYYSSFLPLVIPLSRSLSHLFMLSV
jgi:hypothetical protein